MYALDTHQVVVLGSQTSSGVLNAVSAMDTTVVLCLYQGNSYTD